MITIVAGTARARSRTLAVARIYEDIFLAAGASPRLLSLEGLPVWERSAEFIRVEEEVLVPTQKFFLVVPEYNGSFPGALKHLIDTSDIKRTWWGKKAALTGVADGRAGNLRGLDHLTNILNYLKVTVLPNKVPISRIDSELAPDFTAFRNDAMLQIAKEQVEQFLAF